MEKVKLKRTQEKRWRRLLTEINEEGNVVVGVGVVVVIVIVVVVVTIISLRMISNFMGKVIRLAK